MISIDCLNSEIKRIKEEEGHKRYELEKENEELKEYLKEILNELTSSDCKSLAIYLAEKALKLR